MVIDQQKMQSLSARMVEAEVKGRSPWADARRLSATGGSYGGFLVAWLNGHAAPGRYRSYVCHAGVFDRIATFSADSYMQRPRDLKARYWEDMPRVLAVLQQGLASPEHAAFVQRLQASPAP